MGNLVANIAPAAPAAMMVDVAGGGMAGTSSIAISKLGDSGTTACHDTQCEVEWRVDARDVIQYLLNRTLSGGPILWT